MITITPIYSVPLALLLIFLSIRIIQIRSKNGVAIGFQSDDYLQRAIRAQANFVEYVPFSLVLISFAELREISVLVIHILCIMLVLGRFLHAYGVSQVAEDLRFRQVGMGLTFSCLIFACLAVTASYILNFD